jgi:acyl-CoA thioester hydrolase
LNAREDHLREGYGLSLNEFLQKGVFWVVTGHEILYKRPALYNEIVTIATSLIGMDDQRLHVEMQMWNEAQTELKALMWSHFTLVDGKTGRKASHPENFLAFARSILREGIFIEKGLSARVSELVKKVS